MRRALAFAAAIAATFAASAPAVAQSALAVRKCFANVETEEESYFVYVRARTASPVRVEYSERGTAEWSRDYCGSRESGPEDSQMTVWGPCTVKNRVITTRRQIFELVDPGISGEQSFGARLEDVKLDLYDRRDGTGLWPRELVGDVTFRSCRFVEGFGGPNLPNSR